MQGAKERRLRRMSNTPQGGAIEGNTADDILMVPKDFQWHVLQFVLEQEAHPDDPDEDE